MGDEGLKQDVPMIAFRSAGRGRLWLLVILFVIGAVGCWFGTRWYRGHLACERRGVALDARVQRIKSEAQHRIEIGTHKEEILRFIEENGLRVSSNNNANPTRIVGTGTDIGCPHIFGCGDDALIMMQIDVDDSGNAISRPTVDVAYTNCM
jgi:hypothetical protein